ncbi:hypothetical protein [Mangrovicella endophytica]|uniref:hypothetical protein n=1 Tax=Mangrovicella endophytica TaxID=2066697 RepID=UPI000C9E6934|nr:hypothetical protein [Mangrovicella endophytica]
MRRLIPLLLGVAAVVAALLAGPAAFGKLALFAGLPDMAARLIDDPAARGVALYRTGRYTEADAAFATTGRSATYNRALTLAALGDYPLAVDYFDAVLFADPRDADARFNRDLVARLVEPVIGEANTIDGIPAVAAGPNPDAKASERAELDTSKTLAEQRSVLPPRVGRQVVASPAWLATLTDEPALYLKKRIAAEHERRKALGLLHPPEDTAW